MRGALVQVGAPSDTEVHCDKLCHSGLPFCSKNRLLIVHQLNEGVSSQLEGRPMGNKTTEHKLECSVFDT